MSVTETDQTGAHPLFTAYWCVGVGTADPHFPILAR